MGRPSTFTPELGAAAVRYAREGVSRRAIAGLIGVPRSVLYDWLDRAEAADAPADLAAWATEFARAEGELELHLVRRLRGIKAEAHVRRSAEFLLARRFPRDWQERAALEHSGPEGGPVSIRLEWPDAHPDDDGDDPPAGAAPAPG